MVETLMSCYGMRVVDKAAFFATVGQMNVHPTPDGVYDFEWGYVTEWRSPQGHVAGVSVGGTHLRPLVYLMRVGR